MEQNSYAIGTHRGRGPEFGALTLFLTGIALGSALMFIFDPVQGHRRRVLMRDKGVRFRNDTRDYGGRLARNIRNRIEGLRARVSHIGMSEDEVDDEILQSRVRSKFGRKVSHARSIHVDVHDGVVTLTGPILRDEVQTLLRAVGRVPGVRQVVNRLDVHETSNHVSGLQGEGKPYLQ